MYLHSVSDELRRLIRTHGAIGLLARAGRKALRRLFKNDHVVLCRDATLEAVENPDLRALRFDNTASVPNAVREVLIQQLGPKYEATLTQEFRRQGILYVALWRDALTSVQWCRTGSNIEHWFVPLHPKDLVIFGSTTFPAFRGRGIIPAIVRHQVQQNGDPHHLVYADCKVWNKPARRVFQKLGFRTIARMRPLRSCT